MNIVSDEKDLLSQIDEFRQKAEKLQSALDARVEKAEELEQVVTERQEKADELEQLIAEREKQADVIKRTVHEEMGNVSHQLTTELSQMQGRIDVLLKQSTQEQLTPITNMTRSLDDLSLRLESVETNTIGLADTIHKEGVQVYRNSQELIKNLEKKVDKINKVDKHVGRAKGPAIVAAIFAVLSFGGIVFTTLLTLGYIQF